MCQKTLDPRRHGRGAIDRFPETGMDELQASRMPGVAVEHNRRAQPRLAIRLVAHDVMADRGEVDADLVGAPGFQMQLQEGEVCESLEHAIACDRPLPPAGWSDRHLHPV